MINITFKFHNYKRKDGTYQLLIRLRTASQERIISTEIHIDKSKWDNSNKMVRSDHIAAQPINKFIKGYHDKIKKIKPLFELGEIDFEEAHLMLTSSGSLNSLEFYRENFCKRDSAQWHRNTKNSLNAFKYHIGIKHVNFKDITRENILKMKDSVRSKGMQGDTHNNYLRHIRAVYNKALADNTTYREFNFSRDLFEKTDKHSKKLLTNKTQDIALAIKKITLKSKRKSAVGSTIRDLEAIGFWLLKFSLRGMYGKDIVSLSANQRDYNYEYFITHQKDGSVGSQDVKGNPYFLDHKRHKTGNMMRIWINLPPIGGLIYILRRLVAQTHPNLSYLSFEDLSKPYNELIQKPGYDELKIFRHNSKVDLIADENLWNNLNKHLRKLDVYSFESARKSFNTTARILGIEEGIKKTLIGQTDHSIQRHYDNYNDPELVGKVQLAHLGIMHHFKVIELYELWLKKLEDLFGAQNDNLYVGASSDIVYMDHYNRLPGILKSDRTEISKKPFWVDKLMVSK
jgi:hypothetical protein|tara:strand:- start:4 stop:1545 length:1542 start_codon:yes stop_codon:yes gene_type:complete